ncbi:hypothetical protein CC1G_09718 [Coprinopsis cinerea okayama7|uniref:Microbial-type PARG catalytic domain-containing protein n=1 Tax=Coprinopsis cinerea (strain Okayama-7 / 130 / ATCC MYA-4618 / FGSC 9003) TaxID=240176 RepID=A8NJG3_COPC7|nr:hypothetical protein CC1G_09718 [Coprinopsis cinerea okayama7\|eukprot:XP_001834218.1 hypothetical protein CC1G_09718 [Coprinopsis cinerea okayama7\
MSFDIGVPSGLKAVALAFPFLSASYYLMSGSSGSSDRSYHSADEGDPWFDIQNGSSKNSQRERLKRVAEKASRTVSSRAYTFQGTVNDLGDALRDSKENTQFFSPDSELKDWGRGRPSTDGTTAQVSVLNITTIDAARLLHNSFRFTTPPDRPYPSYPRIGVLNFASATKPGGGFRNGIDAQEESIARVSTLYHSLDTREGKRFYRTHTDKSRRDPDFHFYTHSMIYSPHVIVFLNDDASYVSPVRIEVVSCAAVNAKELIPSIPKGQNPKVQLASLKVQIDKTMLERMARILYLFEKRGIRNIVLGTFGTGVFRNEVGLVARHWASLLIGENARFSKSFDRVIFAITGNANFGEFHEAFEAWGESKQTGRSSNNQRSTSYITGRGN